MLLCTLFHGHCRHFNMLPGNSCVCKTVKRITWQIKKDCEQGFGSHYFWTSRTFLVNTQNPKEESIYICIFMALTHCMLHVEGLDVVMCAKHPSQKKGSPFKNRNSLHWTILRLVLTAFHMINCLHSYCCADETRARVHFLLFCDVQLRAP